MAKVTKPQIAEWLKATFPEYRGRKFNIETRDAITFYDLNWDGGTRNEYRSITPNGTRDLPKFAPWANPIESQTITIPDGVIVACHKVFCGTDLGVTFYVKSNPQLTA